MGGTRVICTAKIADEQPAWRRPDDQAGWVTAEYAMMPASTPGGRKRRGPDSRGTEIRRLIGRVLRCAVNLDKLGPRTIALDCDVLEADGGTRTASITGAYVAMAMAVARLIDEKLVPKSVLAGPIAAISVGVVDGKPLLDLDYAEDSRADVDLNVAMNHQRKWIEIQGTAEAAPFDDDQLEKMLALARRGIGRLHRMQRDALRGTME